MVAEGMMQLPGRRRARRLIPAAVIVGISGLLLAVCLYPAVRDARNAARSADTT